jgi:hypothetical protein
MMSAFYNTDPPQLTKETILAYRATYDIDCALREIGAAIIAALVADIVRRGDCPAWWDCDWRNYSEGEKIGNNQPYDILNEIGENVNAVLEWEKACLHWWGRVLTGSRSHWCADWDELPIDETCEEWPCGCYTKEEIRQTAFEKYIRPRKEMNKNGPVIDWSEPIE